MISHRHHHARATGADEAGQWRVAAFSAQASGPPGRDGAFPGAAPVASALWSRTQRLWAVLLLNLGLVTALVVAGITAHSLAAAAAGADCLADAGAIGVSLLAIWLASRPPTAARPRGYPRATNIAALVNAGWLLALNVAIAAAAIWRLAAGSRRVEGLPVLIVSAIAAVVMLAGALILRGDPGDDDGRDDLNVKAVLLDTAGDTAAAGGVAVSGAIILGTGWYWLDPAAALAIAVIVGYHAQKLTRRIIAALRSPPPAPSSAR
jgi:cobalt-zinc-cadmium efflux system protein